MDLKSEVSSMEGVLVISCDAQPPEFLIQKILNVDVLPSASVNESGIKEYKWNMETKYYSVGVNLYAVQEKNNFDEDFCSTIRATVFYFNGKEKTSFDSILTWMPLLENVNSDVQLLVCESCDNEEALRKNILNWCVEKQFELIELNESEESDNDDETPFSSAKGCGRVIEALQSHTWSNLVMKKSNKQQCDHIKNGNEDELKSNDETSSSTATEKSADNSRKMKVEDEELLLEEQWLQKVLEQDDPDGESFEALFSKFASMKEKASGLAGEERKKYAEKVAIAFWKAMGGDEDEIEGLDD